MKRLPNDYGTIQCLSGNRARPFAAYTPKRGPRGKAKRECLGYFETAAEAMNALKDLDTSSMELEEIIRVSLKKLMRF